MENYDKEFTERIKSGAGEVTGILKEIREAAEREAVLQCRRTGMRQDSLTMGYFKAIYYYEILSTLAIDVHIDKKYAQG